MSKHTAGPWAVNDARLLAKGNRMLRIVAGHVGIARVNATLDDRANARLIAAAPDLLAELTLLCNLLEGCGEDLPPEIEGQISFSRSRHRQSNRRTRMNAQAQAWSQFAAKVQRVCPRETREIALYASAHNLAWSDARDALEEQKGREYVIAETMDGRYPTTD